MLVLSISYLHLILSPFVVMAYVGFATCWVFLLSRLAEKNSKTASEWWALAFILTFISGVILGCFGVGAVVVLWAAL